MVHKVPGHKNLLCSLKQDRSEIEREVKQICIGTVSGWDTVSPKDITVSEISGGITNLLWKLTPSLKSGLGPVVVRVFGEQTDLLIDREREKEVLLQLNEAGFGAPILSTFDNGRVEGFLDMRTLTPEDMTHPAMAVRIARRLKQFHTAPIRLHGTNDSKAEPFKTLWEWLDMAKKIRYDDEEKQRAHDAVDIGAMEAELALTEKKSARLHSPIVWSHNDLLSGNVLVSKQEVEPRGAVGTMPSMQFIDFEYGCHSYRGYDWGNHFCEYAGFECVYSRYPDKEHVALFIRAYLSEGASSPPSDEEVEAAVAEANFFALVSHQFWGIWALIQARYSPIDFDYFGYSKLRWDEYYRRKDEFLSAIKPFLTS